MKVELLKNKETSIIEKIIISKGVKNCLSDVPFNLTHKQTLIGLDEYDLEWHELIMSYSSKSNPIEIRSKLYREFDNREVDYLITILDSVHHEHFSNEESCSIEAWYFNYYMWAMFYLITNKMRKTAVKKAKMQVVDPMILLFADGIKSFERYNVFHDFKKAKDLANAIWYHQLDESYQKLHVVFSKYHYNNELINLEIFKKEVMKLHHVKEPNLVFWNSKKNMIRELLVDLIKEKIHYA